MTGFFKNLLDTIAYIHEHGWKEYRAARKRYDEHHKALDNIDSRYNHKLAIKQMNAAKKLKR